MTKAFITIVVLCALIVSAATVRVGRVTRTGNSVRGSIQGTVLPNVITLTKGHQIATSHDGVHALIVGGTLPGDPVTKAWVRIWTTADDVQYLDIPGWLPFQLNEPVLQFVGTNKLLIASAVNSGAGPIRVNEFDISSGVLVSNLNFEFGSTRNRLDSESIRTIDGGMLFGSHWQDNPASSTNGIQCDIFYRPPPQVGDTTNVFEVFHFNGTQSSTHIPHRLAIQQNTNGIVHILWGADSYGRLGLSRFTLTNGVGHVDTEDDYLDSADADIGPSGEHPRDTSSRRAGQVLFSYQSWPHIFHPSCDTPLGGGQPVISSFPVITSVETNKTKALVVKFDWRTYHGSHPYQAIWPQSTGIHFLIEALDTNACTISWRRGFYTYAGGGVSFDDIGAGKILAYSTDGWVAFEVSGTPTFFKMPL